MATVFYFAYMSNMSPKRVLQSCPSAKVKGIGKLPNYKLVFIGYKEEWKGACANCVPAECQELWGVIWEVAKSELEDLEGTEKGASIDFSVPTVEIVSQENETYSCLLFKRPCVIEVDAQLPSPQYLQLGIQGAVRNHLPQKYVDFLKSFPTNGNTIITDGMKNALE